ncbi:MAG: hypothetical protein HZA93_24260 [Verrucomicrobia bacterium]|nr:hypothetical protein [Verrucomicrobiota bacterium]
MKLHRFLVSLGTLLICALAASAADATGTWKWKFAGPNGEIETTLKLTSKDGKLAGTYANQYGETAVADAALKDDTLTFSVERDLGGNKFTLKFKGKLEGDAIKGEFEAPGFDGGAARKVEWHATRVKEEAGAAGKK